MSYGLHTFYSTKFQCVVIFMSPFRKLYPNTISCLFFCCMAVSIHQFIDCSSRMVFVFVLRTVPILGHFSFWFCTFVIRFVNNGWYPWSGTFMYCSIVFAVGHFFPLVLLLEMPMENPPKDRKNNMVLRLIFILMLSSTHTHIHAHISFFPISFLFIRAAYLAKL